MQRIQQLLIGIPFTPLLIAAILLGLAPFTPQPHAVEKLSMLIQGNLVRPIDIFDLFFHLIPSFILLAKLLVIKRKSR